MLILLIVLVCQQARIVQIFGPLIKMLDTKRDIKTWLLRDQEPHLFDFTGCCKFSRFPRRAEHPLAAIFFDGTAWQTVNAVAKMEIKPVAPNPQFCNADTAKYKRYFILLKQI